MTAMQRAVAFATMAMGIASCGGSSVPPVSEATACQALAAERCAKRDSCTKTYGTSRTWGDLSTCNTREALSCMQGFLAAGTGKTVESVRACTASLENTSCSDFLDNNLASTCYAVGTIASGSACSFQGQCTTGYCANDKNAVCGTCGTAPVVGDSCVSTNCDNNQACNGSTSTCVAYGGVGDACNTSLNCAPDLACVGASATANGTCQVGIQTVGAACGTSTTGGCDPTVGLYCAGTTGTKACALRTLVANGATCGTLTDGTVADCISGTCYTSTGIVDSANPIGACKAFALEGRACDAALGPTCLSPARCVVTTGSTQGTCTLVDATNACGSST